MILKIMLAVQKKKCWMLVHIGRMMGGYTASLTAFIVVNAQ